MRNSAFLLLIGITPLLAACGDDGAAGEGEAESESESEAESEAESESEGEWEYACPKTGGDGAGDVGARLADGEVRAGRTTDAEQLVGGDSTDGRVGDFKIYNSRVEFVVQNERLGDNYIPYGGNIIDGDLVQEEGEPDEDRIDEFATAFFVSPFEATSVCVIADGSDGEAAIVRAVGVDSSLPLTGAFGLSIPPYGLVVANDYTLAPDANAIEVLTRVRYEGTMPEVTAQSGDFVLLSDDGVDPYQVGPGFERGVNPADLLMSGVAGEHQHLAYGFYADGPTGRDAVVTPLLEALGSDDMAIFFPLRELTYPAGEVIEWRRYVAIGRDLDEINRSRYAAQGITDLGTISGTVTAGEAAVEGARVHFVEATAGYVSFARTGSDGTYSAVVPAGSYTVAATGSDIGQDVEIPTRPDPADAFAHGFGKSAPEKVAVAAGDKATADLAMTAPGHISIALEDPAGDAVPGKLSLAFVGGTDPSPPDPILGERNPYGALYHQFWTVDGTIEADVEPGAYTFIASWGYERELASAGPLAIDSGETTSLTLVLVDVVDSSGYLQGDHHMHGGPSIHGECTMEMRVVTNIAEGLDYYLASDHDRVIDYGPTTERLGLDDRLKSIQSNEISTFDVGHFNPAPLLVAADEMNGGATPWWNNPETMTPWTPQDMFDDARDHGAAIVQINHGWGSGGYFANTGFDTLTGEATSADFTDDFDAMETHNGKGGMVEELFDVYAALLNHGYGVAPTGVSDSHHRIPEAGAARTYLAVSAASGGDLTDDAWTDAMAGARTVVSGGPFIRLIAEGEAGPGEMVTLAGGDTDATLDVQVSAPSWIPVERIRIYRGQYALVGDPAEATVVMEWDSNDEPDVLPDVPGTAPVWLDEQVELPVTEDTWFLVRVDGTSDLAPAYTGAEPLGHTAAVFIDVP